MFVTFVQYGVAFSFFLARETKWVSAGAWPPSGLNSVHGVNRFLNSFVPLELLHPYVPVC